MAGQAELEAKVDELVTASTAERKQVADGLARIDELLKQLAAAQPVDQQPIIDKMQAEVDALKADDPAV